jgi:hypothetical protein
MAQTPRELDAKSARGLFARMWRTEALEQIPTPRYPSVLQNGRGELLLLATDTPKAELVVARSSDGGRTWSDPQTVYAASRGIPQAPGTLTRLRSGRLVAPFADGDGVRTLSSQDDGASWEASDVIDTAPLRPAGPYSRLVETEDELLMPVFGKLPGAGREVPCSGLLRSRDGGRTWGPFTEIAGDRSEKPLEFGPTAVHAEPGGAVLALISVGRQYVYRSVSTDGGHTWSEPEQRLMAGPPALAAVGPTLAAVDQDSQIPGIVRVQFSENLFDSWRCDRMLDFDLRGEHFSAVGLDADRLLLVHDRPEKDASGKKGLEVVLMQRNPAAPPFPQTILPPEKRDRWEWAEQWTTSIPTGFGEVAPTPVGRLLSWSGGRIYASRDQGKTFEEVCQAPPAAHNAGVLGVLRSGRWLAVYPDWSGVRDADWAGQRTLYPGPDGYQYEKWTGVKGVCQVWAGYSDDQGQTWQGGDQPLNVEPLVWSNPYGRLFEDDEGTVILTTYGCLSHEDTNGRIDCAGIFRSADGGKTWGDFTRVAYDEEGKEIAYNEMDLQPLPDGTWVAVIRTEWRSHYGGEASSSSVCFSQDRGRTWTRPEFAFIGAVPSLARLPDGGLVCATSFCKLRFSYDGGRTWSRELPSYTQHYPGVEVVGPQQDALLVHDRWQNRQAALYRRIARAVGPTAD